MYRLSLTSAQHSPAGHESIRRLTSDFEDNVCLQWYIDNDCSQYERDSICSLIMQTFLQEFETFNLLSTSQNLMHFWLIQSPLSGSIELALSTYLTHRTSLNHRTSHWPSQTSSCPTMSGIPSRRSRTRQNYNTRYESYDNQGLHINERSTASTAPCCKHVKACLFT